MHAVKWPPPEAGAADALEGLYRQHHEMILRTAYRLTRSMGDAEDVLHGLFLKLMQREKPFGDDVNPGPYLHRAAVNAAIDILRCRKQIVPLEAVPPSREATEESQSGLVSRAELAERLRAALTRLPAQAAEIFVLRHVEGYSNREIGRLLGISWGSVAVAVHRARRRLQSELQTEWRALS
jgi:RNA polymerase sigma-70 factor (ECF subfamily)